mmetsp:Transcript_114108/g.254613  ORF Transcript_114108/g.254613 Transcript_114108/m.254613 type:complete len:234 (+) Transcript_114108:1060-1761(+)
MSQGSTAVPHMGDCEQVLVVIVEDYGCCCARIPGIYRGGGLQQGLHFPESVHHHLRHLVCPKAVVSNDERGQVFLHEVGHVVAICSVTVEDPIDGELPFFSQHKPRILVRALRLVPLSARHINAVLQGVHVVATPLSRLLCEGVPHFKVLVGLRAKTELSALLLKTWPRRRAVGRRILSIPKIRDFEVGSAVRTFFILEVEGIWCITRIVRREASKGELLAQLLWGSVILVFR